MARLSSDYQGRNGGDGRLDEERIQYVEARGESDRRLTSTEVAPIVVEAWRVLGSFYCGSAPTQH